MQPLYPDIKPYRQHSLAVESPHVLYLEEVGNPEGVPVLFLHGGPGAGCSEAARCFFDPELYRIVLFDQRGCGRSTPHACAENNTTWKTLEDMEAIRQRLGIERWVLFGGSWGSTLALAYAQTYTDRVLGMILRGVFLCRQQDMDWLYKEGASRIFPEAWEAFQAAVPAGENILAAYQQALASPNELNRMIAARAWAVWELTCASLLGQSDVAAMVSRSHNALSMAILETHYFTHSGFLKDKPLLEAMACVADIPGIIVHGRYDMVCPLDNAYALHKVWPESELRIIREGGHSAYEPAMTDALVHATHDMLQRLKARML